jgi:hypothetical protein
VEYGLRKRMFIVGEIGQADAAQQAQYYSIEFKYRFKY